MNVALVSSVVSLIPVRVTRVQSGTHFTVEASSCRHLERVAHLAKFLQWLSPLDLLGKQDQRLLGLLAANGKRLHAGKIEDAEAEAAVEPQAVA